MPNHHPDTGQCKKSANRGRLMVPRVVRDAERKYIHDRREAAGVVPPDSTKHQDGTDGESTDNSNSKCSHTATGVPLVGLALSGGGIRSATFCLGALQALARANVLRLADYMCTVSGGGYIGSCLSSLLTITQPPHQRYTREGHPSDWKKTSEFDLGAKMPLSGGDPDQIHHLRTHGDFLVLRDGLLGRDVLRTVGTAAMAILSSVALYISIIIILTCLFFLCSFIGGYGLWELLPEEGPKGWIKLWKKIMQIHRQPALLAIALGGMSVVVSRFFAGLAWKEVDLEGGTNRNEIQERYRLKVHVLVTLVMLVLTLGCVLVITNFHFHPSDWKIAFWYSPQALAVPVIFFLAAFAISLLIGINQARMAEVWTREERSTVGTLVGSCLYGLIASLLFVASIFAVWWVRHLVWNGAEFNNLSALPAIISMIAARLLSIPKEQPPDTPSILKQIAMLVRGALISVAVLIFVVSCFLLTSALILGPPGVSGPLLGRLGWSALIGVFFLFFIGICVDFNRISPHDFYRDRLSEAYLQTEVRTRGCLEIVRDDSDLRLCELHDRYSDSNSASSANPTPYHLIECAVNLAGSRDLARKYRKSDVFIFSKYFCGSTTTGYVATHDYDGGNTQLATAITTSGAAASSGMGFITSLPRAFAMTLFNLRLGLWFPNPRSYSNRTIYPTIEERANDPVSQNRTAEPPSGDIPRRSWYGMFWPWYLFLELTASTTARVPWINLSDGGHTGDNIGIYPLLQRRCRLIIACDAEADGDYSFGSLVNAIRQINVDENVQIDIDIDSVKPPPETIDTRPRVVRRHFLVGRISYPGAPNTWTAESCPEALRDDYHPQIGWLICLKSSVTNETMPPSVQAYRRKNESFPHQSTADQFFDDDQFEAYRALGHHVAETVLRSAGIWPGEDNCGSPETTTEDLIQWCESHWDATRPRTKTSSKSDTTQSNTDDQFYPTKAAITRALRSSGGNFHIAAKLLKLPLCDLERLVDEYKIDVFRI